MTQQGITETRMHSDSNLDSHYHKKDEHYPKGNRFLNCLLYTSPSPRDLSTSRMPSSA